jgi:probable phosphoglycerate mutase
MHGRAMRILLSHISGLPLSKMDDFPHDNTCLYRLWYYYENNQFEIISKNETHHFELIPELSE